MRSPKLKIVKIGGSLFSDKNRPYSLRLNRLMEIGVETAEALDEQPANLLIVHGGGSYGHYVASLHLEEKKNYDGESFSLIADTMLELALTISDALRAAGLRTAVYSTHALWYEGELFLEPLKQALSLGVVPVLYGDVVMGRSKVEILSGDLIVREAALRLGADTAYFASDVDGIYDKPPSTLDARLVEALCPDEAMLLANRLSRARQPMDVTGGISLKLRIMSEMAAKGIRSIVFNGLKPGSFYMALTNNLERCTVIQPCRNR